MCYRGFRSVCPPHLGIAAANRPTPQMLTAIPQGIQAYAHTHTRLRIATPTRRPRTGSRSQIHARARKHRRTAHIPPSPSTPSHKPTHPSYTPSHPPTHPHIHTYTQTKSLRPDIWIGAADDQKQRRHPLATTGVYVCVCLGGWLGWCVRVSFVTQHDIPTPHHASACTPPSQPEIQGHASHGAGKLCGPLPFHLSLVHPRGQ